MFAHQIYLMLFRGTKHFTGLLQTYEFKFKHCEIQFHTNVNQIQYHEIEYRTIYIQFQHCVIQFQINDIQFYTN